MVEIAKRAIRPLPVIWAGADKLLLFMLATLGILAFADASATVPVIRNMLGSLVHTLPFILFAVLSVGYLKASGAERIVAQAFVGRESRMIVVAALLGGLSPFCSCEVIPFIAGLLALGAPLSAVMALWLSSPLMDPGMFAISAGAIGLDFALAKTVAAIGIGIFGGFMVRALASGPIFAAPLRTDRSSGGCCAARKRMDARPVWRFWREAERRGIFGEAVQGNLVFLLRWLAVAYLLEALMLRYVPAEWIAGVLGGSGPGPVFLGALVGAPAYMNGYAAVPLIGGLLEQGMSPGAAMSFVIAGGVSCVPAAVAVWALVKPRVFLAYIALGFVGAVTAGLLWAALA